MIGQYSTARCLRAVFAVAVLNGFATAAHATVTISDKPTKNMTCSAGVCAPTKAKANLNVTDLANLLAAGDTKVISDGKTIDIEITDAITWASATRLTLDSYHSIRFTAPVTVAGTTAGLTITTNDGGTGGDYTFTKKGHVEFWDLASNLTIGENNYALVKNIRQLAKAIAKNPAGSYALAKDYNADNDGVSSRPSIQTTLDGIVEGLGNRVLNLTIHDPLSNSNVGFFAIVGETGLVRDLGLVSPSIIGGSATSGNSESVGTVAGLNLGTIRHCYALNNRVTGKEGSFVGGIVGFNSAGLDQVWADGKVSGSSQSAVGGLVGTSQVTAYIQLSRANEVVDGGGGYYAGGLIGDNRNSEIDQSFATGTVSGASIYNGGLTGSNEGEITNSYSTASVSAGANTFDGGLVGSTNGTVDASYSIGLISANGAREAGGFAGNNLGSFVENYWDLDTSGFGDSSEGCGEPVNCPGATGLTTAQFQSGLPTGFDPAVWGQAPTINNGYPYLLANPPPK